MKKLITSYSVPGKLHRFTLEDFETIQEGSIEGLASIVNALRKGDTQPIILNGCVVTKVSTTYTWTAGAIDYNGEIYQVASGSLTTSNTPNWAISQVANAADPIVYSDGSSFAVHINNVISLIDGSGVAAYNAIKRIEWLMWNNLHDIGDVHMKIVDVSDFDSSGLGKQWTKWEGWAYMNGANGTTDMGGFFPVGQKTSDPDYDNLGDSGGAKTVALSISEMPRHNHDYKDSTDVAAGGIATSGAAGFGDNNRSTSWSGGNGAQSDGPGVAHENRPPFKTLRLIQKIA